MYKYVMIYTEALMEVCVKTKGVGKGVSVFAQGSGTFTGWRLELWRECWQKKAVMLKSGEGILDEGGGTGYNRELSGSTEKSLQ